MAKQTQEMYGTKSQAAVFEISANLKIVIAIKQIITIISTNAPSGHWNLKNKIVHQKFKNNCAAKIKHAKNF